MKELSIRLSEKQYKKVKDFQDKVLMQTFNDAVRVLIAAGLENFERRGTIEVIGVKK